jgi:hypothetical protein
MVFGLGEKLIHPLFSMLYLVIASSVLLMGPKRILRLWRGVRVTEPELAAREAEGVLNTTR